MGRNARQRMTDEQRAAERAMLDRDAARHPEDAARTHGANARVADELRRYRRLTWEDVHTMTTRGGSVVVDVVVGFGGRTEPWKIRPTNGILAMSRQLEAYIDQDHDAYGIAKRRLREERPDLWRPIALAHYSDRAWTTDEIADRLGCSPRTVLARIGVGLRLLRCMIDDEWGAERPDLGQEGDADPSEERDGESPKGEVTWAA